MTHLHYLQSKHFPDEHPVPPHRHPCWEFVYYSQAKGIAHLTSLHPDDKTETVTLNYVPHTYVLIPPNDLHDECSKPDCTIYAFGFEPSPSIAQHLYPLSWQLLHDQDFSILKYCQEIATEYEQKRFDWAAQLDCLLHILLTSIIRGSHTARNTANIDYCLNYMQQYYMTDININELAANSGFSPSHFRCLFKERMGVSPKQYLLNLRLSRICTLLRHTDLPFVQIANETGFPDYYHFSSFFKKKTGLSPKHYRERGDHDPLFLLDYYEPNAKDLFQIDAPKK